MGLSIYSNVISITARRSLGKAEKRINQSLNRLSTGLRINSAKDDGVGLIQSEKLLAKQRGMDTARSNIANAESILNVAEGYLQQLTEISQEIRDIATQASSDTISASTRTSLMTEASGLMQEYNKLANNADFNGAFLLNGSFVGKDVQVGPDQGDEISISVEDARANSVGKVAIYTSQTRSVSGSVLDALSFSDPSSITIGGSIIGTSAFSNDGVSSVENDESAIAYVNAINSYANTTGVTAVSLSNVVTFNYTTKGDLLSAHHLLINGVTTKSDASAYNSNDAGVASIVALINAKTGVHGVTAVQKSDSDSLVLKSTDGRNITVGVANTATSDNGDIFGLTGSATNRYASYRGTFQLTADAAFEVKNAAAFFASAATFNVQIDATTTLSNISLKSASEASSALSILDKVIEQLQTKRSNVGSLLNRLDIADAELETRSENYDSAISSIRDADIAAETAEYTKANLLKQSATIVLSQANAQPDIALTLLSSL